MSETTFQSGNSYGPDLATVQFAVGAQAGALGTFIRGARRLNRISFVHVQGVKCDIKVQQSLLLGPLQSWSDVGSGVTLNPLGEDSIDVTGLVTEPYARLYGGATVTGAGTAIVRAQINDMEKLHDFFQVSPYGVG